MSSDELPVLSFLFAFNKNETYLEFSIIVTISSMNVEFGFYYYIK